MSAVASQQPIVAVSDLRFSYLRGGAVVSALRGVSLDVQPGEAVGLVGESGSGKSTLARVLLGLTHPRLSRIEAGRVVIDGQDVTGFGPQRWQSLRGHPLAMMFQALGTQDVGAILDATQVATLVLFVTFYLPCVSTFAAMLATLGRRAALQSCGLSIAVALAIAGAMRWTIGPLLL